MNNILTMWRKQIHKGNRLLVSLMSLSLMMVMIISCIGMTGCGKSTAALTQYWAEDSEAAQSLRDYVTKVTNKNYFNKRILNYSYNNYLLFFLLIKILIPHQTKI